MSDLPCDSHGILLRRDAVRLGFNDNWLARMRRSGRLVRVRHGAYADPDVWTRASLVSRHILVARATLQQYDDRVALSHTSAHLVRGGPDLGLDLSKVHLTHLYHHGDRTQAGVVHHRGEVRACDISRWGDHWITSGARAAMETAALVSFVKAVCLLDWAVHNQHATVDELTVHAARRMREWPGTAGLTHLVKRVDGRSESVGETRLRLVLEDLGYQPEPQWEVRRPSGGVAGIVDFLLREQGVMVEFDGRIKYGRLLKSGQTVSDVILAERHREIELQELTGLAMVRVRWDDLSSPRQIDDRLRHVADQRRRLRVG